MKYWLGVAVWLLVYVLAAVSLGVLLAWTPAFSTELRRGELELLARVVQAEATGEPAAGQRAVAWTVLNRLKQPEVYGRSVTQILQRPYQYANPAPLNATGTAYLSAMLATVQAVLGVGGDVSLGATHFYVCSMARPPTWARRLPRTAVIGRHCFHKLR